MPGSFWTDWQTRGLGEILRDRLRAWWRSLDRPDPWSPDLDAAARAADALPVCHRCLTPFVGPGWFCANCGAATGPYNNTMPYLNIFSCGEVWRAGFASRRRPTPIVLIGEILTALLKGGLLAVPYMLRLLARAARRPPRASPPPVPVDVRATTPRADPESGA